MVLMINEFDMKNTSTNKGFNELQYVTVGKKKYGPHVSLAKKDNIIKSIEIIVVSIVVIIAAVGIYGMFNN